MKLPPELEARILAMPGTRLNGRPVASEAQAPTPAFAAERDFQSWLNDLARSRGWLVYHTHDSRRSESGFPDTVMLREHDDRSRLVIAELKMPGQKPKASQRKWLRLFERFPGAEVYTWWPEDSPSIIKVLT